MQELDMEEDEEQEEKTPFARKYERIEMEANTIFSQILVRWTSISITGHHDTGTVSCYRSANLFLHSIELFDMLFWQAQRRGIRKMDNRFERSWTLSRKILSRNWSLMIDTKMWALQLLVLSTCRTLDARSSPTESVLRWKMINLSQQSADSS